MQKKQLRTFAIIALIAIFVIGSIMRLNVEPADLGKGETQQPSQVVENVPTDDESKDNGENTDNADNGDGAEDEVANQDANKDENKDENNGEDDNVSGGDTTAVSDAEKNVENKQPAADTKKDTAKTDTKGDTTDSNSGSGTTADSNTTKTDSSDNSGAWPPIPDQTVADPKNPQTYHCTMEIYCTTLLNADNIDNEAIVPYIPEDGVILPKTTVQFTEGENAFDVILRACRNNDIQFEFREDSLYSGAYVEGINYIYEFDGGPLSGWMYKVNGQFPNYGCKRYIVQDGDAIVWMYTCDLGRDVGDNSVW